MWGLKPLPAAFEQMEAARASIPRTLMLVGEEKTASHQWRVTWPCRVLSDHGFVADWCLAQNVNSVEPLLAAGRYNTLLTPRAHWNTDSEADAWLKVMHSYGVAWVYELDDDGWSPDIVARQARLFETEWRKGEQQLEFERQERIRLINCADGIVVSSQHLAETARKFTDQPVYYVPNLIDIDWFAGRQRDAKRIVPPLTIGWSGGIRDEQDLTNVAEAWHAISITYPTVRFIVHGTSPRTLTSAVPADRLTILSWSSLPDYPRALMNIDIACCAVAADVDFNKAKTPIKWMEASLAGAACVVSSTLYGPVVRDGYDALVAETPADWTHQLGLLIDQSALRRRLNRNAKKTIATSHSIQRQWPLWLEALGGALEHYKQPSNGQVVAHAA